MRETVDCGRQVLEKLEQEIREADSVYTPTTTASQLSLETRNNLFSSEENSYIDFFICEEKLCLKREFFDPIAITGDKVRVTNLSFQGIGTTPPSIKIILTLEHKHAQQKYDYDFSVDLETAVSLRSY